MTKGVALAFWALAFALATGLSWLIPPMQSPDETSHLARAYLVAQGHWLLQPAPEILQPPKDPKVAAFVSRLGGQADAGGLVDPSLLSFMAANLNLALDSKLRLSAEQQQALAELRWSEARIHFSIPRTGYYFPLVYAPQAAGLAIGMALDWSVEHSYRLARTVTLLACFLLLAAACRLTPPSPLALATLLLPMSLFQLLSPTLDGLTTSLGLLTLSLFLRQVALRGKNPAASAGLLSICVLVLVTSRTHLLPLLALPFLVAWQRRSARDFSLAAVTAAGALAWVLFALHSTTDTLVLRSHTGGELLRHYAMHPGAFLAVVFASLSDPGLSSFYQQSFIGILGWLDTALPALFYPLLWIELGACALASISFSGGAQDRGARWLLLLASLASVALIFLSQLVTWTPHPATLVQGVQGRYFVMPVLMLGYALSGAAAPATALRYRLGAVTLGGFALTSLLALTMTLLSRYH